MYCKLHKIQNNIVLACCDNELLGKSFRERGVEIKVSESFYGNVEISKDEALRMLKEANSVNLLGNESVKLAIDEKIVSKSEVVKVAGLEHVVIIKV
ncbi:MAG: DUF424 family protein [Candidatus Diapherotrites archaeon]